MRSTRLAAVTLSISLACAAPQRAPTTWQRTELYFGLELPGGGQVSEDAWRAFVGREIAPRFPQGFTLIGADGAWRSASGELTHEPSRVLILLHKEGAPESLAIDEIRAAYKRAFHQDSVLRADAPASVSF